MCPGEDTRNSIEDVCEIIRLWEEKILTLYNDGLVTKNKALYQFP